MSNSKLWLAQFLFDRRLREPSGRPLHTYRISEAEFLDLTEALRGSRQEFYTPLHRVHWCACFCMHVAESYRRRYDAAVGWTWHLFESPLSLAFSQQERSEIVRAGLNYWRRPVRRHEQTNDYLGSLFAEGGLPWTLISSPTHGFGRAVKSGVRHYYLDRESGRSVPARMAEFHEYFPRSFRTEEVSLLLAGIVTQLISIVETIQIRGVESPIARLDREMPNWRESFPIPLDEDNATQLVSEWLVDAERERKVWQGRTQLDLPSTCAHRLTDGELSIDRVLSVVTIQREVRFPNPSMGLSGTRLEMVCYEGDSPTRSIGSVYAVIEEGFVRLRSSRQSIELQRKRTREVLSLRLLDSGAVVHYIALPDSELDAENAPAIFERVDDAWWYLSSASCSTRSKRLLIRLPASWAVASGDSTPVAASDGARWIETGADIVLSGEGELINASFADSATTRFRLAGSIPLVVTRPEQTFLGWPRLVRMADDEAALADQIHMINRQRRARLDGGAEYGAVLYQLCNASGATLYRQRFGVLPVDFRVRLLPRQGRTAAKLTISAGARLLVSASIGSTQIRSWEHSDESVLELPAPGLAASDDIRISIRSRSNPNPVVLQYPFPFEGARVTNAAGEAVPGRSMTLDELLGMEAVLFAGPTGAKKFRIVMSLLGERGAVPTHYSTVQVADVPVRIRLHSFADEIAMLLGVSDQQDCAVRLLIESGIEHVAFRIGRYKHRAVQAPGGGGVIISEADALTQEADVNPAVMCIPEPDLAPIPLSATTSQTTGATSFEVSAQLERDGPWLVHALPESRISFRPLFLLGNPLAAELQEHDALGAAIRGFHPTLRPALIEEEVARMGADPEHTGWNYLKQLKDRFSHLPLSVFEVWRAVASNSRCLALAVLRMELSVEFCHRMQIDLAVVWESVPIGHWQEALATCSSWFRSLALSDSFVAQFRESCVCKLKMLWPGFDHFGTYLEGGPLPASPPLHLVLPGWYQTLRTQHAEDEWPMQCGPELRRWVAAQDLPQEIKDLAAMEYTIAVTYLPIFLAFVTAGRAKLELPGVATPYLKHAVRHVASFDRALWFAPVHGLMTCHLARASH